MATQDVITYLIRLEDKVTKELKETQKETAKLEKEVKSLRKAQEAQADASDKMAKRLENLKSVMKLAAVGFTATSAAMAAVGVNAVKTGASLEAFETRLSKLLGSAEKGKQRIDDLFELSAKTPFSIDALVEADTTLEAFGVNANKVRGGVLDLAAVTGMDLKEAADAVGRAMVGGAGAADMLRDKGVRGWVEQRAGIKATKMSLEEWQEALVDTLNNSEKVAGGTAEMSRTFAGLFSTLRDQWTLFSKDISDANLFATVKASMKVLLESLGDNRVETQNWAKVVGEQLSVAFLRLIEIMGVVFDGTIAVGQAFMSISEAVVRLIGLFRKLPSVLSPINALADAFELPGSEEIKEYANDMAFLSDQLGAAGGFATKAEEYTAEVKALRDKMVADKSATQGKGSDGDGLMRGAAAPADEAKGKAAAETSSFNEMITKLSVAGIQITDGFQQVTNALGETDVKGIGTKFAEEAFDSEGAISFAKEMKSVDAELNKLVEGMANGSLSSAQLTAAQQKLSSKYLESMASANALGEGAQYHFDQIRQKWVETMQGVEAAIPTADQLSVGQGMAAGADFLATGGMSALGSMGPAGAAAGTLIGMGQQGQQAADRQAEEQAREKAKQRQQEMKEEAEAMKAKGFSQDEIAAAGLGRDEIAAAGQATEEEIAKEREGIDIENVMAEQVKNMIVGLIEGIKAIIVGLPEILAELIPLLLTELPNAIIESIPALIEGIIEEVIPGLIEAVFNIILKVIPRLIVMLGKLLTESIPRGVGKAFKAIWSAIKKFFRSLFDFDFFQTGGFVPKTGMALVHQGERVIPASGAGSQTATKGLQAFTGGAGPSLTINTNVVDPDSIASLGRLMDRELGSLGRQEVPMFGETQPITRV